MGDSQGGLTILPPTNSAWQNTSDLDELVLPPVAIGRISSSKLRVLLVEDDPGDAELVKHALRESRSPSFQVTHAAKLGAALDRLQDGEIFDVVLLDLSLPDSAGVSTLSKLQAVAPRVPIVIMTGLDDPQLANYALEVGAQDYLVKSDDPERTVVRAIRYAITRMNALVERDALAERVVAQQRVLLKELEAARTMQFHLLPRPEGLNDRFRDLGLDVEAAFEPSLGIGGDLWGCMDSGDGKFAFYTFDFAGHGISAALNVFRLHALITERWDPRQQPAELLRILGTALHGLLKRGQYATMFVGVVDTVHGELEWSAAGAPAPVLAHAGKAEFLDSRGVPLGLSRSATYANHRKPFPIGASLLLYSDAITDALVSDDQSFGEDGLMGLVQDQLGSGDITISRLLDQFFSLIPPPLQDDLTAVRISRVDRGRLQCG
jgi:sigma-B regulation protein RsbU (phosphoserine phosphatase)